MLHPEETVQSQYAASQTIRALVDNVNTLIDPRADISLFYDKIFNPKTAEGIGLKVWARIVGLQRTGLVVSAEEPFSYFQTDLGAGAQVIENFNHGPFWSQALEGSGYVDLESNALRWLIFWKAQANVSGATLYELNHLLVDFVQFMRGHLGNGTFIEDTGLMELTAYLGFQPTAFERNVLNQYGLFNKPAGVLINFYPLKIEAPLFGFANDGEQSSIFGEGAFFDVDVV